MVSIDYEISSRMKMVMIEKKKIILVRRYGIRNLMIDEVKVGRFFDYCENKLECYVKVNDQVLEVQYVKEI